MVSRSSSGSFSLPSDGSIAWEDAEEVFVGGDSQRGAQQAQVAKPTLTVQASEESLGDVSLDGSIDIDIAVAEFEQAVHTPTRVPVQSQAARSPGKAAPNMLTSLTAEPPSLSCRTQQQQPQAARFNMDGDRKSNPDISPRPSQTITALPDARAKSMPSGLASPISHTHSPMASRTPNATATAAATTAAHLANVASSDGPNFKLPASPIKTPGGSNTAVARSPKLPNRSGHVDTPTLGRRTPPKTRVSQPGGLEPILQEANGQKDRTSCPPLTSTLITAMKGVSGHNSPVKTGQHMLNRSHANPLSPTIQSKERRVPPGAGASPRSGAGALPPPSPGSPAKKAITPGGLGGGGLLNANDMASAKKMDFAAAQMPFVAVQEDLNRSTRGNGFSLIGREGTPTITGLAAQGTNGHMSNTEMRRSMPGNSLLPDPVAKLRAGATTPPRTRSSRTGGPQLLPHLESQRSETGTMLVATHVAATLGLNTAPSSQQLTQSASMRSTTPGRGEKASYVQWSFRHREPRASFTGADPELEHLKAEPA